MNIQFRIFDEELSEASIDLENGVKYRVGNNMSFDIFIPYFNNSAEEQECVFEFILSDKELVFIQSSHLLTSIDYENKGATSSVDLNTINKVPSLYEFMGVKFAFCEAEDSWEKWYSVINSTLKTKNEVVENAELEMSEEEKNEIDKLISPEATTKKNSASSSQLNAFISTIKSNFKALFSKKKLIFPLLILVFFGIVSAGGFYVVKKYSISNLLNNKKSGAIESLQAIKQIEVNLPSHFSSLKFMTNATDMVNVIGVVKNQEDITFLQKQFEKYLNIVHIKVITSAEAIQKINTILKQQNMNMVSPEFNNSTYRMSLEGMVTNLDQINDVELAVSNHVPEVSDIDTSQIYSIANVDKDIDDLVTRNNLGSRLTVKRNLSEKTVYITGYLNSTEIAALSIDVDNILTKYKGLIKINIDVKDAIASLPFKIVAVTTGGFPSFMTETGQKVFEGTEIEGLKIDKISPTEIIFSGKFSLVLKLDDVLGSGESNNIKKLYK